MSQIHFSWLCQCCLGARRSCSVPELILLHHLGTTCCLVPPFPFQTASFSTKLSPTENDSRSRYASFCSAPLPPGRAEEAEPYFRRAQQGFLRQLGRLDPEHLRSEDGLRVRCSRSGEDDEQMPLTGMGPGWAGWNMVAVIGWFLWNSV